MNTLVTINTGTIRSLVPVRQLSPGCWFQHEGRVAIRGFWPNTSCWVPIIPMNPPSSTKTYFELPPDTPVEPIEAVTVTLG